MRKIKPPDLHHLNAALGWLGLGLHAEAASELDCISPANAQHPEVLEARWTMHAQAQQWDTALQVARQLLGEAPERAAGWLHCAYATRRAAGGGLAQAWAALRPAAEKFPAEPIIPFNLACYACQLGRVDEARVWLDRAVKLGGKERIKELALADADLAPLWDEIRQL
jgi:Flp pilus assembly protein TadD